MTTAFVLGNGISRKGVDLHELKKYGKVYGCNALYREFAPDVLVATDRPIAAAIQESGYAKNHVFYTRRPLEGLGANQVPKEYFGYSSGPISAAIAAKDGHSKIFLLGFDMGPDDANKFNNIYAGTEFYKPANSQPTFTGNWIKQLIHIFKDYSTVEFVRVLGTTTTPVPQLETCSNFSCIDFKSFTNQFQTP